MSAAVALLRIQVLRFGRTGFSGHARQGGAARSVTNALVALAILFALTAIGFHLGTLARVSVDAGAWLVLGALVTLMAVGAVAEVPPWGAERTQSPALGHPFLDALPMAPWQRPLLAVMVQPLLWLTPVAALLSSVHPGRELSGIVMVVALTVSGVQAGAAVGAWSRILCPFLTNRSFTVLGAFWVLAGTTAMMGAKALGPSRGPARLLDPGVSVLAGNPGAMGTLLGFVLPCGLGCAAYVALRFAARWDQVRAPAAARRAVQPPVGCLQGIAGLEKLLTRRESLAAHGVPVAQLLTLAASFALAVFAEPRLRDLSEDAVRGVAAAGVGLLAMSLWFLMHRKAQRSVARDQLARPLLCTLPIEPRELLAGKVAATRAAALPFLAALVPWSIALPGQVGRELLWRAPMIFAACWIAAYGSVHVAFLTRSVAFGKTPPRFSLDAFLLMLPLMAVVNCGTLAQGLLRLSVLAAVTWAAGRAAQRAIRWTDDTAAHKSTEVWRAMLAFGAFQLIAELGIMAGALPGASAVTLLSFTLAAQLLLAVQSLSGNAPGWPGTLRAWARTLAGLPAGVLAIAAASGFFWVMQALHIELPVVANDLTGVSRAMFLGVVVLGAPIAEELFFRGWLQPALGRELPHKLRPYAFGLTAVMFAAIHSPVAFVPVLVLGLLTGMLRQWTGGVLAGIFTHVVYNAVLVALAGT